MRVSNISEILDMIVHLNTELTVAFICFLFRNLSNFLLQLLPQSYQFLVYFAVTLIHHRVVINFDFFDVLRGGGGGGEGGGGGKRRVGGKTLNCTLNRMVLVVVDSKVKRTRRTFWIGS